MKYVSGIFEFVWWWDIDTSGGVGAWLAGTHSPPLRHTMQTDQSPALIAQVLMTPLPTRELLDGIDEDGVLDTRYPLRLNKRWI